MKRILMQILLFLLLPSCMFQPNVSGSNESSASNSNQPVISTEPYSFSEVNTLFGPGPFSANELVEIFGEPTFVGGYYYGERAGKSGFFVLSTQFENIMFDLAANNGEKLNFITKDSSFFTSGYDKYEVTDSDKDVRMKTQIVSVFGGDWALPRKMKFGDSIDILYEAYNGNRGKEREAQGLFLVSYDYGESGRITYGFHDTTYNLERFTIEWYDAHNWEDVSAPSGVPAA